MSRPGKRKRNFSSLLPKKGWQARNYHYLVRRVLPAIRRKRVGSLNGEVHANPEPGKVRVTWTGHAGFFVQFAGASAVIDPNWAKWHGFVKRQRHPGVGLDELPEVDLVLVSHAHYDHMHKKALRAIDSREGIFVPLGSGNLVRRLGFHRVVEMELWEEREIGGLQVLHTPSDHWGARFIHDTHRDFGGYCLYDGEKRVFHCGDSAYFDQFGEIRKRAGHIDVALMPIGAYGAPSGRDVHMNPEEALQAYLELDADRFIPMHYGTFPLGTEPMEEPLERLLAEADRLGVLDQVTVLEEGVGIEV